MPGPVPAGRFANISCGNRLAEMGEANKRFPRTPRGMDPGMGVDYVMGMPVEGPVIQEESRP